MKSILTVSVFIILFTSFAQKDSAITITPLKAESPANAPKIDSVSVKIQNINERYQTILEKDEIIDKKIAEIIKDGKKERTKLKNENKKLAEKVESKNEKIDSLSSLVQKYEDATILVDSVCVRWGFLAKHIDANCKEWKIIIVK